MTVPLPFAEEPRIDVQYYGFFDYGRAYNLSPGSADRTIDSIGAGVRSNLTPWLFVELEGLHRLTTHVNGALAKPESKYAIFSRVVAHY